MKMFLDLNEISFKYLRRKIKKKTAETNLTCMSVSTWVRPVWNGEDQTSEHTDFTELNFYL